MYRLLFLLLLCGAGYSQEVPSFNASQLATEIDFKDNQTISVKLALDDTNRIVIANDHITSITCARANQCVSDIDTQDGSAFFGLTANLVIDKPLSVVIKTTKKHALTLLVIPENIVSQTIVLNPISPSSIDTIKLEKESNYRSLVSKLISGMINYSNKGQLLDGLSVSKIDKDTNSIKSSKAEMVIYPIRIYSGFAYSGIEYIIKNNTTKSLSVNPKKFYKKGVLAAATSKETLLPQELSHLYILISKGEYNE